MQTLERIANVLSGFGAGQSELPVKQLLAAAGVPLSSGYKLVNSLVEEGFLLRTARGRLALGPAAAAFFYAPVKALPPLADNAVDGRRGSPLETSQAMSRMTQWNPNLLNLVSTTRYRKEPPFVIGFANASTSSPWRLAMASSLMAAAQRQRDVVSRVVVRDADDDPQLQIRQIQEMHDEKVDLCILSAAANDNAELSAAVHRHAAQGMPFVGVDRLCGEPRDLVSFVTASDVLVGRMSALWLVEHLGGAGRILMLCGRRDASPCRLRLQAAMEVLSLYPKTEVIAIEFTNWEASIGYEIVKRHLATGPVPDGVWCDSGLQGAGSLQAFSDAGFKRGTIPPHTGGEVNLTYKLAFEKKVPMCSVDYPAAMGALSFHTALDTLFGRQVPQRLEANLDIVISRGHETASVKADMFAEEKVRWDREDDYVHASGWIPGMSRGRKPFFT
jgi:ribose transport system substrate-binding protein